MGSIVSDVNSEINDLKSKISCFEHELSELTTKINNISHRINNCHVTTMSGGSGSSLIISKELTPLPADPSIAIYLATHKSYTFPTDDIYIPMQAGSAINESLNYERDDVGCNISNWNKNFCELTVAYWAWKNATADIVGLGHYRRIPGNGSNKVFTKQEIIDLLQENDAILLSNPLTYTCTDVYTNEQWRECDVPSNSTYSQYRNIHEIVDMDLAWFAIRTLYPEYVEDFVNCIVFGSLFIPTNLIIAKKPIFDNYCKWLFDILFFVKKYSPYELYGDYQNRVFGFLAERLQALYFYHNKIKCGSCSTVDLESELPH